MNNLLNKVGLVIVIIMIIFTIIVSQDEHHHEGSYDEHIWTSPENAIIMVNTLKNAMENIDKKMQISIEKMQKTI